jgi:hypothetical protein
MVTPTLRATKGAPLTNAELDANFSGIAQETNANTAAVATKLEASAYNAADVMSKVQSVDGAGSGLDADLLDGQHASAFATAGHNHDAAYLGKTAKAADSELLDGFNSTAFLRAVNGVGPDANGNVAVNVDLSSRVAKTGDTMTGQLNVQARIEVGNGADAWINMTDNESPNGRKYIHANSNLIGFVGGDGNWKMYVREDGHVWSAAYGWLNDYFFRSVSNCAAGYGMGSEVVSNCGNVVLGSRTELVDEGGNLRLRTAQWNTNCNCTCK